MNTRILAVLLLLPVGIMASEPAWWAQRGVKSGATANNKGPINQGQLKAMAKAAMLEMDANLPLGSSPQIQAMIDGFVAANTPSLNPSNKLPANIGQLKVVAKPFYDWLLAMGYNTKQNLINHGAAGWAYDYPWTMSVPPNNSNYAPASVGQLKWVFSFDLTSFTPTYSDSDSDGWADWEETVNFGSLTANATSTVPDFTNLDLANLHISNPAAPKIVKDNTDPLLSECKLELFSPYAH